MAVPADGVMTLAKMLYFFPSSARVFVSPIIAAFAVEYCAFVVMMLIEKC